jgi:multidrug efflux pump subunit AcrA (membrane-fusion protein)
MRGWIAVLAALIVAGVVGLAGWLGFRTSGAQAQETPPAPSTVAVTRCDVEQSVTAPGSLVNTRQSTVEMPAAGRLGEIRVRAGDVVQAGEVLALLDEREKFQAEQSAAELELLQARAALEDLDEATLQKRAEAQLALAQAEEALADAQKARTRLDYPRYWDELVVENARTDYALAKEAHKEALKAWGKVDQKRLTNLERAAALKALLAARQKMDTAFATLNWYLLPASENEIAQADAALALAEANLEAARLNWDQLKDGPDSLEIALAEAKVTDAEARRAAAEKALESVELLAPFNGVVLELKAASGQSLAAGSPVLVLQDPQALEIESTVIEEDLPSVQPGQPVVIFFDAFPEAQVSGRVSRIVPQRVPGDRPLYKVYITVDDLPSGVVAGMSADASITLAMSEAALCLPRAVVRASSGDRAQVDVWTGDHEEKRAVQVGLRGDVYIEILSGLKEGEKVVAR